MRNAIIGGVCALAVVAVVLGISWPTQQAEGQVAISPLLRFEEALIVGSGSGDILGGPGRVAIQSFVGGTTPVLLENKLNTSIDVVVSIQNLGPSTITVAIGGQSILIIGPGESGSVAEDVGPNGGTLVWTTDTGDTANFIWSLRRA